MNEQSINEIQELLSKKEIKSVDLVAAYLDRIESADQNKTKINAVIEINPDAFMLADSLDRERENGLVRSKLHGIPVLLKDNINTADRMLTTAGSLALIHSKPTDDAFIVKKLRNAGAVILGKTNLSEWANFRSSHSTSGWSSRGGLTRNPYDLDRSTCGSSSGSAAAVAANFCSVSVGTETDGSIICPSHANGIVGIKPTLGLISRSGIIPIAHSQDTAGPMARSVDDAAILLTILAGFDPSDKATKSISQHSPIDYLDYQRGGGVSQKRIGVGRQFWGTDPNVDRILDQAIDVFRKLGAIILDPIKIPNLDKYDSSEYEVLLYEFKADLNKYLSTLAPGSPIRTIEDIIQFNERNANIVMPHFGQDRMIAASMKGDLTDKAYLKALASNRRYADREGLRSVFTSENLDALLVPSGCPAWMIDLVNGDHYRGGSSSPAAVSGFPSITVPSGYVRGLPVGLTLVGLPYSEQKLIEIASGFEKETKIRKSPIIMSNNKH